MGLVSLDSLAKGFTRDHLVMELPQRRKHFLKCRRYSAPVHVNFQFKDYITKLLGADPGRLQKMSSNPEAQCPDLPVVEELHNSFKLWEQQPGVCSLMAVCIASSCMQGWYIMAAWTFALAPQWC